MKKFFCNQNSKAYFIFLCVLILTNAHNLNIDEKINSFIEVDQSSVGNDNKIQGKMNINGVDYNAICDCSTENQKEETGPKCDPSKLKIRTEKQGVGASNDDIRTLIGNIEELNYVKVPNTSFKCLDGRNRDASLATPGGDAGEFITALIVYEDLIGGGRKLTQDNVDDFFLQYLRKMQHPKFYMCTDDKSVSHIEQDLSLEGLNIQNPRAQLIPDLFSLVIKPENIGDLHLKMMLKYPEQFSIRKEIVTMFITSFYKLLWNKNYDLSNKLQLDILTGDHNESAFVEVRSESACQSLQLAPLLNTKNKTVSVFVNHLDASSIRRQILAQFFSNNVNHHMDPVDAVKMHNRLNHHGYIALEITGSYAAKGLPFYTINLA